MRFILTDPKELHEAIYSAVSVEELGQAATLIEVCLEDPELDYAWQLLGYNYYFFAQALGYRLLKLRQAENLLNAC
jgi:hypothetical protein